MQRLLPAMFLVFPVCGAISAQNLVKNPGFELVAAMPTKRHNGVECAKHWRTPTLAGTDYYHREACRHAGTPSNIFGRQEPHSGEAYAGICARGRYREYIATTLIDTLVAGQDYVVEIYISRANRSIGKLREFGALFIPGVRYSMKEEAIAEPPSLEFIKRSGYRDRRHWMKLSGIYRAEGNEITLIIGPFTSYRSRRTTAFCHYYIDDVSVIPLKEVGSGPGTRSRRG